MNKSLVKEKLDEIVELIQQSQPSHYAHPTFSTQGERPHSLKLEKSIDLNQVKKKPLKHL